MATEDARYRQSSQFRLWSFSSSQLEELRSKTNSLARASIAERLSAPNAAAAAAATSTPEGGSGENTPQPSSSEAEGRPPDFLTPAEEQLLVRYYTIELLRAAKFVNDGTDVQATAAAFFRRFYVANSIMTYPPAEMLKTSLFFGAKAEGVYHNLHRFADHFPNTKSENILAGEFLLCQGIRFSFDVRHPFRALQGVGMELLRYGDIDEARITKAISRAQEILKFSALVTDAYFHFTPSQIMYSALSLADQGLVDRILAETFGRKDDVPEGKTKPADAKQEAIFSAGVRDRLLEVLESCREMLRTELPERFTEYWGKHDSNVIIKPLIKKLKKCRDPDRWDLVALQQAKKEGAAKVGGKKNGLADDDGAVFGSDRAALDAREAKRRKVQAAKADPFGPPLKP